VGGLDGMMNSAAADGRVAERSGYCLRPNVD